MTQIRRGFIAIFTLTSIALPIFSGCGNSSAEPVTQDSVPIKPASTISTSAKSASELHAEGLRLYNEDKYKEAIDVWLKEAELDPRNPNTVNNIGIAYRTLGEYQTAIAYHKKAIGLDPNFGRAYYSLGLAYAYLKDYRNAKANYRKAMELKYVNADTYYAFGYASMQIKEYEEAAGALKKAIEMNPSYYYAQSLVGDCYRLAGKTDLARVEYKKDIDRNPTRALMSSIGLMRLDVAEQPNNADVWFKFGIELKKAIKDEKGFNEAKKAFNETIRINPSYKGAHYELGLLYEQTYYIANYLDMARLEYMNELELHPGSQEAVKALENLKAKPEVAMDSADLFDADESAFKGVPFPQKGRVISGKAALYNGSFVEAGEMSLLSTVKIKTVNKIALRKGTLDTDPEFFYVLEGGKLINTEDVILESSIKNPLCVLPDKKGRVIKNPIKNLQGEGRVAQYGLWLQTGETVFKSLGSIADACEEPFEITWSPGGVYGYLTTTYTLFRQDGSFIWHIPLQSQIHAGYSSHAWDGELLYLRGLGEDDAVYVVNPGTKEIRTFLDIPEGGHINNAGDCPKRWEPVRFENGLVKALFQRAGENPPEERKSCMFIDVTADKSGKIIKKDVKWGMCD